MLNAMIARTYAPSAGLALLAGVLWILSARVAEQPILSAFASVLRLASTGMMAGAIFAGVAGLIALLRWDRGQTYVCTCGGMLGFERDGRWGVFKRCLACGRNVAKKHYDEQRHH